MKEKLPMERHLEIISNELIAANERLHDEIELRKKAEKSLQRQVLFEKLVADVAARFVNLPVERIDSEIENSQQLICEFLDIDRSTIWLASQNDSHKTTLMYLYQSSENPQVPKRLDGLALYPWSIKKLVNGETLVIHKVKDLPLEAACDRETWNTYGTKSTLVIPMSMGEEGLLGILSFGMTREERDWEEVMVQGLQLVAQVFANAIERAHTGGVIREEEIKLRIAMDVSGAVLWSMDLDTNRVLATPQVRDLFGLDPNKEIFTEDFLNVVHKEDRQGLQEAIKEACKPGGSLSNEFRVEVPGRDTRWVLSQGRISYALNGEPDHLTAVSVDITERKMIEQQLRERLTEIEELKQKLENENIYLKGEVKFHTAHDIVGQSDVMKRVLEQAEQVASTNSTVLIMGETGTGKELLSRAIHRMSTRNRKPMVTVNCASLPPTLIESELFGREKGAYTGAMTKMIGRFEVADGSTLFLDEIGELSFELQTKLLRVLEEGVFERLGSTTPIKTSIRLIAATNRDLAEDVKTGRFRKDLYYRLNVFPIMIPSLRERAEDIPLMVWTFVNEFQQRMGKRIETISKKGMEVMKLYSWPGNVRELRNVIERAMITTRGEILNVTLPLVGTQETFVGQNLQEVERRHIMSVLEKTHWRVTGKGSAAEVLGLKRSTLQSKMKKLGIRRPTN
jgi:formate hydrogenlyase transcriptional activator